MTFALRHGSVLIIFAQGEKLCPVFVHSYAIAAIPTIINGVLSAGLHVSFPIVIHVSFGFKISKFYVVIEMITALSWDGMCPREFQSLLLTI